MWETIGHIVLILTGFAACLAIIKFFYEIISHPSARSAMRSFLTLIAFMAAVLVGVGFIIDVIETTGGCISLAQSKAMCINPLFAYAATNSVQLIYWEVGGAIGIVTLIVIIIVIVKNRNKNAVL